MSNPAKGSDFTPTAESLLAQSGFGSKYRNLVAAGPSAMAVPIAPVATTAAAPNSTTGYIPTAQKRSHTSVNSSVASPEKPMKPKAAPKPPKPPALSATAASSVSVSTVKGTHSPGIHPPVPPPKGSSRDDDGKATAARGGPAASTETPMNATQQSQGYKSVPLSSKNAESPPSRTSEPYSILDRIQKFSFRDSETAASAVTTPPPPPPSASAPPARPLSRGAVLEDLMDGVEKLADRTIIREGDLQKLSRRGYTPLLFILTEDALIYCSHVLLTNKLKHNRTIPLNGLMLRNAESARPDAATSFKILTKAKSFYVQAAATAERNAWFSDIEAAATKEQLRGNISLKESEMAPILELYDSAAECKLCSVPFSIVSWRHHCKNCGTVVCAECSREKLPTKTGDKQLLRVCNRCADILKDNRTYGAPRQVK